MHAFYVTVQNPCANQNGGCMHECRVDGGKPFCDCKFGYLLAEDGKTCEGSLKLILRVIDGVEVQC